MSDEKPIPTTDTPPTPAASDLPGIQPATLAAGRDALEQTLAESAKRGRGRPITHGKYAKKIPVPKVAAGSAPVFVDDALPGGILPADIEAPGPPLDEATLQALAEGLTGLLEDLGSGWLRAQVLKATKDTALAAEAAKGGKISDTTKKLIVFGAVQTAKKYMDYLAYGPEVCLGCGIVLYVVGIAMQNRTLAATLEKQGAKTA
jgi:hypothetical protein